MGLSRSSHLSDLMIGAFPDLGARCGNRLARAPVFSDGRRLHGRRTQGRRQERPSRGLAASAGNRRIDAANRARASTSQPGNRVVAATEPSELEATERRRLGQSGRHDTGRGG
jgi:hypothetical protein